MTNSNHGDNLNFFEVVKLCVSHWKVLLITSLTGAIVAFVICLAMPKRYKSNVTVFPASFGSISQILSDNPTGKKDYMAFGQEDELEQLQQIFHSNEIRNRIFDEFNLMEHYQIDPKSKYPQTKLNEHYDKNVTVSKTRYQSVEVEVYDTDPHVAAAIANRISDLVDTVYHNMQKERAIEALRIVENELAAANQYVQQIEDSLGKIRLMGINNYRAEAEVYNAAYAEAISKGNRSGLKDLENKIATLSKYGGASLSLLGELELAQKRAATLRDKYQEAYVNATRPVSIKYVVNKATASEQNVYPNKTLTVALAFAATFFITLSGIVIYNKQQQIT